MQPAPRPKPHANFYYFKNICIEKAAQAEGTLSQPTSTRVCQISEGAVLSAGNNFPTDKANSNPMGLFTRAAARGCILVTVEGAARRSV